MRACAIPITAAELRGELQAGGVITDIANAKGVAPESIVDAFVAQYKSWLDEHVADGGLSPADARLALLREHATAQVNRAEPPQPGAGSGVGDADGNGVCNHAATIGGRMSHMGH